MGKTSFWEAYYGKEAAIKIETGMTNIKAYFRSTMVRKKIYGTKLALLYIY